MSRFGRHSNFWKREEKGPPASSKLMLASLSPAALLVMSHVSDTIEKEMYKHCGMRLKLLEDEKERYKISPSTGCWKQDMFHPSVSILRHLGYEYSERILRIKPDLEKLYLNDVQRKGRHEGCRVMNKRTTHIFNFSMHTGIVNE